MSAPPPRSLPHLQRRPCIHASVYVDPTARINGDVHLGEGCSVWFNASLRGVVHSIHVGPRTSIQDNCVLHTTYERHSLTIGAEVTVGHGALLHGCRVGDRCLVGMGAVVLDGAVIGDECVIGAGAVVTPGTEVPDGHLVLGCPGKILRPITDRERAELLNGWEHYVDYVAEYRRQGRFHGWEDHPLRDR